MSLHVIENENYKIEIFEDNYLEYTAKEGALIDAKAVKEGKEAVVAFSPGIKYYVFAQGVEFFTLTKEAREICATKEHSDNTVAIAFYTANISILLLGEIYNKINKPAIPTKIFSDREKAKEWLKMQMKQTKDGAQTK